jgi:hypothetical protein
MSTNKKGKRFRIPFVGTQTNFDKCTTHFDNSLRDEQNYFFGCPRYFFRFDFTSAISSIPIAYCDWVQFITTKFTRTTFMGHISHAEWTTGPIKRPGVNPFITLDSILPSRFVLAHERTDNFLHNHQKLDVAFVSLDTERLGDNIDDGCCSDFGDNKLRYLRKKGSYINDYDTDDDEVNATNNDFISPNMIRFLRSNIF